MPKDDASSFFVKSLSFIILHRNKVRIITVLTNNGSTAILKSRLSTSMKVPASIVPAKGINQDVVMNVHMLIFSNLKKDSMMLFP